MFDIFANSEGFPAKGELADYGLEGGNKASGGVGAIEVPSTKAGEILNRA